MPGGSVNGRPFREDPGSYSETGIPRGNPQRYTTHGVLRMNAQGSSYKNQQMEPPVEAIETEGERQLQRILKRQLETDISLEEHKSRYKKFSSSSVTTDISRELQGELSYQHYRDVSDEHDRIEELRQCGLTEDEIHFKLMHEAGSSKTKKGRLGMDPSVYQSQLEAIEQKILAKQKDLSKPDHFSGAKVLTRHEMDLEQAVSHNRENAKFLSCLVAPDVSQASRGSHSHIITDIVNKQNMKNTESEDTVDKRTKCYDKHVTATITELTSKTYLDNAWTPVEPKQTLSLQSLREKLLKSKEYSYIKKEVKLISEEEIKGNRLSVEEIKEIPRFAEYAPGKVSQTLYIKNLVKSTNEEDLLSLFKRFKKLDDETLSIRLMSGKMKGQAFITFRDTETAAAALDLANGYKLRGKPIIIQYGNQNKEQ